MGGLVSADRVANSVRVAGIGHHVEDVVTDPPHDDVVDHGCVVLVQQMGVLRATWRDLVQIVGERCLQSVGRVGALNADRAEMRDVEHDRVLATGKMLLDRAHRVRERHLPTAEGNHLRVESAMHRVERAQVGLRHHMARRADHVGVQNSAGCTIVERRAGFTPPMASTLSTPWPPRRITSINWSPSHKMTSLPLMTRWALAMSVSTWVRRYSNAVRTDSSLIPASSRLLMTRSSSRSR